MPIAQILENGAAAIVTLMGAAVAVSVATNKVSDFESDAVGRVSTATRSNGDSPCNCQRPTNI